jgi:hypothetical protein
MDFYDEEIERKENDLIFVPFSIREKKKNPIGGFHGFSYGFGVILDSILF